MPTREPVLLQSAAGDSAPHGCTADRGKFDKFGREYTLYGVNFDNFAE